MGWWFGRKSAPADARPFVPAWLNNDAAEEGFARFMTFEVIADAAAPAVGNILADASGGAISSDAAQTVSGYAAYGRSIAAAAEPLVSCFDLDLFDDGSVIRPSLGAAPVSIGEDELGSGADGQKEPRVQREQMPVRAVPSALRLTYYDPARDFQTGEARATAGEAGSNEVQQELPAVLSAHDAKTLVQQMLATRWSARDRVTLRLPPSRIGLDPGSVVLPGIAPDSWIVEKCVIDGLVTVLELRPAPRPGSTLLGEAGRIVESSDIVEAPTTFALIDVPMGHVQSSDATILIASSSPSEGWWQRPLTVSASGQTFTTASAARKSELGRALTALAHAEPYLIDEANAVEIELIDQRQWLTSCDDDALSEGVNLAVLGSEVVQFGEATPLGEGRFRLGRLLRARGGTDWAAAGHSVGELFCLLDLNSLRPFALPAWFRGSSVTISDRNGCTESTTFAAHALKPLPPSNIAVSFNAQGDLTINWTRRSRVGFAWLDEVDAPLGESREQYWVTIANPASDLEIATEQPMLVIPAADLMAFGNGTATIGVRQVGDCAASRPAQLTFNLP
jgi:hypothetical protein